jgi:hypothetical protein
MCSSSSSKRSSVSTLRSDYRYGSDTVYQIEYHFVRVTKYRYKVLRGEIAERVRELV